MDRSTFLGLFASLPFAGALSNLFTEGTANSKGFKVAAGRSRTGSVYTMKGVTRNTLVPKILGKDCNDQLAVFEQIGETANGGPPLHIHPSQDEWFHILEGAYVFQVGEDRFEAVQGDLIFLPRGIPHAFLQRTDQARAIVSYSPAGKMEAFFMTTSEWNSPPDKSEVARVFAAHDMEVIGPPLALD